MGCTIELLLMSIVLGGALAVIETQERLPNENQVSMNNLGGLASAAAVKLTETAVPGKSSRYIIRFARTPSSMIRFSRSPSRQIRFGRSQPFVRFGRGGEMTDDYGSHSSQFGEKYVGMARNGMDDYYGSDENLQVEPRSGGDSGFIRFGRSQNFATAQAAKTEALRALNWRNFLRLGRNTNANIRFAGKRDGSSTGPHHNAIPIEMLLEKFAQKPHDQQDERMTEDDQQPLDETNPDQYQAVYSNANELPQN